MITYKELIELVSYDPDTGLFVRLKTQCNSAKKGAEPGYIKNGKGGLKYRGIQYKGKQYHAHRLAYLYMTKTWPDEDIDHIDGDGTNNKWSNIRAVTKSENQKNRRLNINSKSGVAGVSFYTPNGKWRAAVSINGKSKHLGYFDTIEEAKEVRKNSAKVNGYHVNHGQKRRYL